MSGVDVLQGNGICFVELPPDLRRRERFLRAWATYFRGTPAESITRLVFYPEYNGSALLNPASSAAPPQALDGEGGEDRRCAVAVMPPTAVSYVLGVTDFVFATRVNDRVLHRGKLTLGTSYPKMVVEGLLPAPARTPAATTTEAAAMPNASLHAATPLSGRGLSPPQPSKRQHGEGERGAVRERHAPPPHATPTTSSSIRPSPAHADPTAVAANTTATTTDATRKRHHLVRFAIRCEDPKFEVTPYILFQVLRSEEQPSRILIIDTPAGRPQHETHALVEVRRTEHAIRLRERYQHRTVELRTTHRHGSRGFPQRGEGEVVEVKLFFSASYSADDLELLRRFVDGPDGSTQTSRHLLITPDVIPRLGRTFARRWVQPDGSMAESWPAAAATNSPPRSPALRGRKHARLDEVESVTSSSHRSESTYTHERSRGHRVEHATATATSALMAATSQAAPHHQQHQHQHLQQPWWPTTAPLTYTAAPTPACDERGPLPLGWRPAHSAEYNRTYYVYADPITGVESTTWVRP